MAPKKSKNQKMALSDFLADEATGSSWADEMDALPSAPGEFSDDIFKSSRAGDRGGFGGPSGGSFGGMDRDSRPPRPDVPFPTQPPYTAFVGNMSFECSAEDVKDFFTSEGGLSVLNVRMVTDFNGKAKGFCYAEFPEAEMLRTALGMTGAQLAGRTIRVSVAEPPREGAQGRSAGDWTRSGPLPDLPGRGGPRPMRDGMPSAPMDSGRDWGDARGSRFAPSAPSSPALGAGRPAGRMGGFRDREVSGGSVPEESNRDWGAMRGGKFTPSPAAPEGARRPSGFAERKSSQGDAFGGDWRARASPLSPSSEDAPATAPPARKKLELSARSVSSSGSEAASPSTSASRSGIFGAATPVNTAEREQAVLDQRIEKERAQAEERRAALAAEAEKRKSSNPFGAARPVDNSAREKEVDAKLAKNEEELHKRMEAAKLDDGKDKQEPKAWRRDASRPTSPPTTAPSQTAGAPAKAPTSPKQILKNQGIRKEGFSYSNIAGGKPAAANGTPATPENGAEEPATSA